MPRIHGIRELLSIIFTGDERIREFIEINRRALRGLEESYITARYGPVDYEREDAEECLKWRRYSSCYGGLEAYISFVKEKMALLSNFPKIAPLIYNAVKESLEQHGVDGEIYFFGSVVEGRFTASSDIDVAVVAGEVPKDRRRIIEKAVERLERWGMPIWLPLEVHFMTRDQFERMKRGGANFVRAEDYLKKTSGEA